MNLDNLDSTEERENNGREQQRSLLFSVSSLGSLHIIWYAGKNYKIVL